jgi:hypothetical protein
MKTITEIKQERLEEFEQWINSDGFVRAKPMRNLLEETIDLLDTRTKEVVEEVIGPFQSATDEMSHAQMEEIWAKNQLQSEQRLRAQELLGKEHK